MVRKVQAGVFELEIDTTSVDMMMDKLLLAVAPLSLHEFLAGPASNFFRDDIESRFNEEGDVKSGFWPALSEATLNIRRWEGYDAGPINIRTGDLEHFLLTGRAYSEGEDHAEMQVPGPAPTVVLQDKLETAQHGSTTNPITNFGMTPARPVLAVSEMDLEKLMRMLAVHIEGYLVTGGLTGGLEETSAVA